MIIALGTGDQAVQYRRSGLFKVGELENRFRYPFALCFAACRGYGLQLAVANNMIWIAISDYRTLARLRGGMCS